jgi:hypothetical protein
MRIQELIRYEKLMEGPSQIVQQDDHALKRLQEIVNKHPRIKTQADAFQTEMNEMFNSTYQAVDKFIWPKICPREEMSNDQALLAMIKVFEEMLMLEKSHKGRYKIGINALNRHFFQYGDVLTIKKWHSLAFPILQQMTSIGKEDYVLMMMEVYKRFVKMQDYLHENIHRLQGIYKLFYGGFIQGIQVLLRTKKVKFDPTKGSWKSHEYLLMKIFYAIQQVRCKTFLASHGLQTLSSIINGVISAEQGMWQLQHEFSEYVTQQQHSTCELTRCVANFSLLVEEWLMCRNGVKVGDFILLEIAGCDWISFWAAVSKPNYLLECKRRMEQMYALKPEMLEYLRMNRFVRLTKGGCFVAPDEFCEIHNDKAKQSVKDRNFEQVCERSKYLQIMEMCQLEYFGLSNTTHSSIPNSDEDVAKIVKFLNKVGVMAHPEKKTSLHENSF